MYLLPEFSCTGRKGVLPHCSHSFNLLRVFLMCFSAMWDGWEDRRREPQRAAGDSNPPDGSFEGD